MDNKICKKRCTKCENILFVISIVLFGVILAWILTTVYKERFKRKNKKLNNQMSKIKYILYPFIEKNKNMRNGDPIIKRDLKAALDRFNKCIVLQNKESYTINKNEVNICWTEPNKSNEEPDIRSDYSDSTNAYVIVHELAHVLCDEEGHTPYWQYIFDCLLDYSYDCGLIKKDEIELDNYCGGRYA